MTEQELKTLIENLRIALSKFKSREGRETTEVGRNKNYSSIVGCNDIIATFEKRGKLREGQISFAQKLIKNSKALEGS